MSSSAVFHLLPLRQVLSLSLKLAVSTRLAGQQVSEILLSPLPNAGVRNTDSHAPFLYGRQRSTLRFLCMHDNHSYSQVIFFSHTPFSPMDSGGHTQVLVFQGSILLTELFLQPLCNSFLNILFFFL